MISLYSFERKSNRKCSGRRKNGTGNRRKSDKKDEKTADICPPGKTDVPDLRRNQNIFRASATSILLTRLRAMKVEMRAARSVTAMTTTNDTGVAVRML